MKKLEKIAALLAKLAKGETMTDEDKTLLADFDLVKEVDGLAAAARRDAETKQTAAEKKAADAVKALEDYKTEVATKGNTNDATIKALQESVGKLTKANEEAAKREAATTRANTIRDRAKELGIIAISGVREKDYFALLDQHVGDVDITKPEALDAVLNGFKTANPGLHVAGGAGGSGIKGGNPANPGGHTGPNPFSKKTENLFEQAQLEKSNPQLAQQLQAAAKNEGT